MPSPPSREDPKRYPETSRPLDASLRQVLADRLEDHRRRVLAQGELRRAAVALVVVAADPQAEADESIEGAGEAAVVLTRRAASLSQHSGQFALPGGRLDPGETVVEAALRELHEEVGLELGEEAVLGLLDDFVTRSGYHLTPVVVWGEGAGTMQPNPAEVAEVYRVPLERLADPTARHSIELHPADPPSFALEIVGTLVFAPTAAILLQLGEVAVYGRFTPVANYGQPRFAWV
ncbi:MAG: CoA pyrophosphatase [Holophagales bacterium]|nr:CoA pyrophosphatase [Holophagales bacterium]